MRRLMVIIIAVVSLGMLLGSCGGGGGGLLLPPPAKSSAKAITAYSFNSPAATAAIDEAAKTIVVIVPNGTNVTALVATFTTTGASVKVGSTVQVSGATANDFTNSVEYTVTAADNSTSAYTVTVTARFKDHGDGTITDNSTGLMWIQAPDSTLRDWWIADDYCTSLVFAGHSDWYLPTIEELQGLIQGSTTFPFAWLNSTGFSNVQADIYWSSGLFAANIDGAWNLDMDNSHVFVAYKSSSYYVWPVRSGP